MPGLKTVMRLEARSENGCGKWPFFYSELGSGFGEPGSTPQQEFPGVAPLTPTPPPPGIPVYKFALSNLLGMR